VSEHETQHALEVLAALSAAPHSLPLQQLDLSRASIGLEGGLQVAALLTPSSKLTDLDLNGCHVGDAAVVALAHAVVAQGNRTRSVLGGSGA
jgi:Ran GTPase-activating protein (RanGAP) involved in mRNA processing and transport